MPSQNIMLSATLLHQMTESPNRSFMTDCNNLLTRIQIRLFKSERSHTIRNLLIRFTPSRLPEIREFAEILRVNQSALRNLLTAKLVFRLNQPLVRLNIQLRSPLGKPDFIELFLDFLGSFTRALQRGRKNSA